MHPDNPQLRLIKQAAQAFKAGELIVYPTDSAYAIGCILSHRQALEKLRQLRGLDEKHPLTLLCASISQASEYCVMDDMRFKIFKQYTPGPYTFILPASKNVPRLVQGAKRKVVGIRIPQHPIPLSLIAELEEPILSATLWLPGDLAPLCFPEEFVQKTRGLVDLILDGGEGGENPTSVIDLVGDKPLVLRHGLGDTDPFE